ncbi:MAG TPA: tetratricopeptide repeat protein, partial [Kofleriaceae bacterium]|nr:tetratricopeptide repeat protein [Kofleriaceae bacterium]
MSPKNKGKFGRGKPSDIPETDEFVSSVDRIVRALKPHAIKLAIFFGVIAIIVVSYTVWQWMGQRKAAAATAHYARAVALSQVPVMEEAPEPDPRVPPDPRDLPTHFETRAARAEAVLAALAELDGSDGVAGQADLLAADALFSLGRHAEAAARYQEYISHGGPAELVVTAREGLAYALEAQA